MIVHLQLVVRQPSQVKQHASDTRTCGMRCSIANKTFDRPDHCISAVRGEPRTRPGAARTSTLLGVGDEVNRPYEQQQQSWTDLPRHAGSPKPITVACALKTSRV